MPRRSSAIARIASSTLALGLGLGILWMATDRLPAAWRSANNEFLLSPPFRGWTTPTREAFERQESSAWRAATDAFGTTRMATDYLAIARTLNRGPQSSVAERRERLTKARTAVRDRLRESPADALAWMELADLDNALDGPSRAAAQALMMSIELAPRWNAYRIQRISLGLRLWPSMTIEEFAQFKELIRYTYIDLRLSTYVAEAVRRSGQEGIVVLALRGHVTDEGQDAVEYLRRLMSRFTR